MFPPFPTLQTDRLILRKLSHDDIEEIHFLRSNEIVLQFIDKEPATHAEAEAWITRVVSENEAGKAFQWVLVPHNTGRAIGTICFWNLDFDAKKGELGYTMHPDFHGKGYMQEALSAVLPFGFGEMGLRRVEAFTHRDNMKSRALLERNGFERDKDLEKKLIDAGEERSHATIYALHELSDR